MKYITSIQPWTKFSVVMHAKAIKRRQTRTTTSRRATDARQTLHIKQMEPVVPEAPDDHVDLENTRALLKTICENVTAKSMKDITQTQSAIHKIEVTDGPPVREKMRVVPQNKREEFRKLIEEMVDNGLIVPSESDWASATKLVQKADGSMRITIDFRKLNARTLKDAYPIPVISTILSLLSKAKYYTKLDLMSGYYQIPLDKASRKYTAFRCEMGLFEFTVMPMGLTNATATFQLCQ